MQKIINFTLISDTIKDFKWKKCRYINEFKFFIAKDKYYEDVSTLEVVIEYAVLEITYLIKIHFKELGSLEISTDGSRIQLIGFQVDDIRNDGWSELNYKVTDFEREDIHFYCKQIEIISIDICE